MIRPLRRENLLNAFPKELAKKVTERWENMVAGDYVIPPLPPIRLLRQFFEIAYLAAAVPEEGRYPRFPILLGAVEFYQPKRLHISCWG
jgi:hypothetical protein